jgi:phosphate starvation-inducible PhoH-like protein
LETLAGVEGIGMIEFSEGDVVRHPMVMRIVHAYEARDRARRAPASGTESDSAGVEPA